MYGLSIGAFLDVFDLKLDRLNRFPYRDDLLHNFKAESFSFLPKVKGLSVNKVHGSSNQIKRLKKRYPDDVESMEGVAIFYTCLIFDEGFLEIRAISNLDESRNKSNWDIPRSVKNQNEVAIGMVSELDE